MFPIYVKTEGSGLPADEMCYILGKNGTFMKKSTGLIDAVVKVAKISSLDDVTTYAKLNVPPMPAPITTKIISFLKRVYDEYSTEAVVLVYYSKSRNRFKLVFPPQLVSSAAVEYKIESVEGYNLVGSIHSHPSFSAFHSGTDKKDEAEVDGFHATVGHINENAFTIDCELVVNGNQFKANPLIYFGGLEVVEDVIETKVVGGEFNSFSHQPWKSSGYTSYSAKKDKKYKLVNGLVDTTKELDNVTFKIPHISDDFVKTLKMILRTDEKCGLCKEREKVIELVEAIVEAQKPKPTTTTSVVYVNGKKEEPVDRTKIIAEKNQDYIRQLFRNDNFDPDTEIYDYRQFGLGYES